MCESQQTVFELFHPIVAFIYFAVMLIFAMVTVQPVYLLITFLSALAYRAIFQSIVVAARTLVAQLGVIAVIAFANVVFTASGSTLIFRVGLHAIYVEGLVYGLCMGAMLAGVLLLFSNASQVLTAQKIICLFGGRLPVLGLMLSMIAALIPRMVRRGKTIAGVQRACTAAFLRESERELAQKRRGRHTLHGLRRLFHVRSAQGLAGHLRTISVLMGWSMEDSLETVSTMKARAFGGSQRRTSYELCRFGSGDVQALVLLAVVGLGAALSAWSACAQLQFYPTLRGLAPWFSYIPYVILASLPLVGEAWFHVRSR